MTEEAAIQKSLVEKILDETFINIEGRREFDALTIEKLKQLAAGGGLTKTSQVLKTLQAATGREP